MADPQDFKDSLDQLEYALRLATESISDRPITAEMIKRVYKSLEDVDSAMTNFQRWEFVEQRSKVNE